MTSCPGLEASEGEGVCGTPTIRVESCGELNDLLPPCAPTVMTAPGLPLVHNLASCLRKRSAVTRSEGSSASSETASVGRRRSTNLASPAPAPGPEAEGPPPPTLADTLRAQWRLLLPPALLLLATVAVTAFGTTPPPLAVVYLVAYAVASVLSALWLAGCNALHTRRLVLDVADCVPLVFATPGVDLAEDAGVRYAQAGIYQRTVDAIRSNAQRSAHQDPLAFMHDVLVAKERESKEGHCLIDQTGTVLWCNTVLATFFGYTDVSLVGQNVRVLMPEPYASQHDALLRNYGGAARSNIVGHRRRVPIMTQSGAHSTALLGVEEFVDPSCPDTLLFLGSLAFPDGGEAEDPAAVIQRRLDDGVTDAPQCCASVATHPNNLVVINAKGIIQWVNDSATLMLQYGFGELVGRNVACLMGEVHAKQHDSFLAAYQDRAAAGQEGSSEVVGRSRDLYAKTKAGELVRIFLAVKRVDRPSRLPQDCLFVGTLLLVQRQHKRGDTGSLHRTQSEGTVRSSATSSTAMTRVGALSALTSRKCTLLALELRHSELADAAALHRDLSLFFNLAAGLSLTHKAVLHHPVGDRLFISLNVTLTNNAHRSNAGGLLHAVCQQWRFHAQQSRATLCAVGASGTCVVGQFMTAGVLLSQLPDVCAMLLRAANETGQWLPLIDAQLYEDLQFAFECRPVNVLTVWDAHGKSQPPEVLHELRHLKAVEDDEWMYQIAEAGKVDALLHWTNCWAALGLDASSPVHSVHGVPNPNAALHHLAQHLAEQPDDPVARWLNGALTACPTGNAVLFRERLGKLAYSLQYRRPA